MDPGHAIIRGVKICSSNPELAIVSWAATVAMTAALLVPLVGGITLLAVGLAMRVPPGASGEEVFLTVATSVLNHWGLALALYAVAVLWIGLVLFLYLYAQAGILGCVVRSHRQGPARDRSMKPALGASPAFKVFSARAYGEEIRAQGRRVTLVATAYSMPALVVILAYAAWGYGCFRLALGGDTRTALGIIGALLGLVPVLLALWLIGIHYRFGVMVAVLRQCDWQEAIRGANEVFRTRTLGALVLVGATMGARYLLAMAGLLLSAPFLVLSLLPLAGLLFVMPRVIITLVQSFLGAGVTVAALGATAAVCEPVEGEEARQGGSKDGVSLV